MNQKVEKVIVKVTQPVTSHVVRHVKTNSVEAIKILQTKIDQICNQMVHGNYTIHDEMVQLVNSQILPLGTKCVRIQNGKIGVLIETPPCIRRYHATYKKSVPIAFPYVIFLITLNGDNFEKLTVGFRNEPLQSMDDKICEPPIGNVYGERQICLGYNQFANFLSARGIYDVCEKTITHFWSSEFHTYPNKAVQCVGHNMNEHMTGPLTFMQWQNMTRDNPAEILKVAWHNPVSIDQYFDWAFSDYNYLHLSELLKHHQSKCIENKQAIKLAQMQVDNFCDTISRDLRISSVNKHIIQLAKEIVKGI